MTVACSDRSSQSKILLIYNNNYFIQNEKRYITRYASPVNVVKQAQNCMCMYVHVREPHAPRKLAILTDIDDSCAKQLHLADRRVNAKSYREVFARPQHPHALRIFRVYSVQPGILHLTANRIIIRALILLSLQSL